MASDSSWLGIADTSAFGGGGSVSGGPVLRTAVKLQMLFKRTHIEKKKSHHHNHHHQHHGSSKAGGGSGRADEDTVIKEYIRILEGRANTNEDDEDDEEDYGEDGDDRNEGDDKDKSKKKSSSAAAAARVIAQLDMHSDDDEDDKHAMNAGTVHVPTDHKAAVGAGLAPPPEPVVESDDDDEEEESAYHASNGTGHHLDDSEHFAARSGLTKNNKSRQKAFDAGLAPIDSDSGSDDDGQVR